MCESQSSIPAEEIFKFNDQNIQEVSYSGGPEPKEIQDGPGILKCHSCMSRKYWKTGNKNNTSLNH